MPISLGPARCGGWHDSGRRHGHNCATCTTRLAVAAGSSRDICTSGSYSRAGESFLLPGYLGAITVRAFRRLGPCGLRVESTQRILSADRDRRHAGGTSLWLQCRGISLQLQSRIPGSGGERSQIPCLGRGNAGEAGRWAIYFRNPEMGSDRWRATYVGRELCRSGAPPLSNLRWRRNQSADNGADPGIGEASGNASGESQTLSGARLF